MGESQGAGDSAPNVNVAEKVTSLEALLCDPRPPDLSGARGSNRYDFQKSWALCLLLRLHNEDEEYVLLLEHFDDVVVLDSPTAPTSISFFQIKTAKHHWTNARLVKQKAGAKGPKRSILGRLIENGVKFGEYAERLVLVSNQPFSLELYDGAETSELTNVAFTNLSSAEKSRFRKKLKEQLEGDFTASEEITHFEVTELSVLEHSTHARGKISEFAEKRGLMEGHGALFKAITEELRRRTTFEGSRTSLSEILKSKGISRNEFEAMILHAAQAARNPSLDQCITQLTAEKVSWSEISSMQANWRRHQISLLDANRPDLKRMAQDIRAQIESYRQLHPKTGLHEMAFALSESMDNPIGYSDAELYAAILFEAYRNE